MHRPYPFPRPAREQAHIDRCKVIAWRGIIVSLAATWGLVGWALWRTFA